MFSQPEGSALTIRDYFYVLRRRKGTIFLCTFLVVAAALGVALMQDEVYEARARVLVAAPTTSANPDDVSGGKVDETAEVDFIQSDQVRAAVREKLGFGASIRLRTTPQSSVITLTASDHDPERAADIANTYAQTYIELRQQRNIEFALSVRDVLQTRINELVAQRTEQQTILNAQLQPLRDLLNATPVDDRDARAPIEEQIASTEATFAPTLNTLQSQIDNLTIQIGAIDINQELFNLGSAEITHTATPPRSPVTPNPPRNVLIGLVAGLLLGIGIAFLFEYLDDTVKTKDDLERATIGLPVLALIPQVDNWKDRNAARIVSILEPLSAASEAYRSLRTSVQFLGLDRPIRTLMITSSRPNEGKTTTLVNLAVALASAGARVVIVSCDLRKPRVHEFFDLPNDVGFTSVLLGDVKLSSAVQRVRGEDRIAVLASGPVPPNPSELLSSQRTADVLAAVQAEADIVLVDAPPVLPVTDALILSATVDATLFIADSGRTVKKEATRAVEMLRQVGAPLVGTVLNGVSSDSGYGYGYGYGYNYDGYGEVDRGTERQSWRQRRRSRAAAREAERRREPASRPPPQPSPRPSPRPAPSAVRTVAPPPAEPGPADPRPDGGLRRLLDDDDVDVRPPTRGTR